MHNDFTVRVSLENMLILQLCTKVSVVINLSVDAKDDALVVVGKRLGTTVYITLQKDPISQTTNWFIPLFFFAFPKLTNTNNSKTLVRHDMVAGGNAA